MRISIVVDNPKSWFMPFAQKLVKILRKRHQVKFLHDLHKIGKGDCAFFLSCLRMVPKPALRFNQNNIVVHGSDLPSGKGFSPISWQILKGRNKIVLTIFEAADKLDSGDIYFKETVNFKGYELSDEIHQKIGKKIVAMVLRFLARYPNLKKKKQKGRSSYYPRRTIKDDELPINKTIAELFNRFRIADNERHPVYFYRKGHKYILKIYKDEK